jgi:hypothetical protein
MSEADGYILRISSDKLVNQVFDSTVYYTNMQRKWKERHVILFLHRTTIGDAFVGYGVIRKACRRELLANEDRKACEAGDWRTALEFLYVKRFANPVLIKDTFLNKSKLRGRYLHGLHIEKSHLESVLKQNEQ